MKQHKKFLLAEDIVMPEKYLGKPVFTYSACETFLEKRRNKKSKEAGDVTCVY